MDSSQYIKREKLPGSPRLCLHDYINIFTDICFTGNTKKKKQKQKQKKTKQKHATKQIFLLFNVRLFKDRNLLYLNKDFSGRPTEFLTLRDILTGTKIVHGSPL